METAARQLQAKFDSAKALLDRALAANIAKNILTANMNELSGLEIKFALTTAHL